jgi:hypothetical protein
MSPRLQSLPGPVTSPNQPTQRVRYGSRAPVSTSRGRQLPTLGRLRKGAVGAAADRGDQAFTPLWIVGAILRSDRRAGAHGRPAGHSTLDRGQARYKKGLDAVLT